MSRIAVLVGFVLFVNSAFADNIGYSFLGMCNASWNCENSKELLQDKQTKIFRWLDGGTFGNYCLCVAQVLKEPGVKIVAPHIANSTCFRERGRQCNEAEVFYNETIASADTKIQNGDTGLLRKFDQAARLTKSHLAAAGPETTVYVSSCLECSLSAASRKILLEHTKSIFENESPRLVPKGYIDNPVSGSCLKGYLCEKHGVNAEADVVDLDGNDFREVDTQDFLNSNRGNDLRFLWAKEFNCLKSESTKQFTDPRQRNCSGVVEPAEVSKY